jgi:dTDP-4-amino-4,6-dideoxygalactose transaminase
MAGTGPGLCPASEAAFERLITLPLFPTTGKGDFADVIADVQKVIRWAHQ